MKYSIVDDISLFVVKKLISMMDEENIVNDILRNPIDNITRPGSILISTSRKHNEELRKWVAIVSTPITRDYLYELIDLRCKVDERYSGNHKRDKEEIIDRYWDEINDESTYDGSTAMDRCISYFSRRVEWNEEQINKINNACRFMDDEYGTDKSSKDSDKKKDKSKTEIKESGPTDLNQLYDDLQSGLNKRSETSPMMNVGNGPSPIGIEHPGASAWRAMASKECEKLKDDCRKHIILDIYCKILPLDDDFKDENMGQMAGDVNSMLAAKNMSATQYLTSASEQTKSPLVEYVLRMTDLIGKQFMENANETLEDAQEKGLEIPAPEAPTTDDEEVSGQLVDIKNDVSYQTFVDELKKKTVNKIVDDVSKIINDKKEENELAFDPKPNVEDQEAVTESAVSVGLNYIQSRFMKESVEISASAYEDMIGLAMREAALNQIDLVFNIPDGKFNNFATTVRLGHGAVINESAIDAFIESAKSPEEVKKVIDDAKKESDKKIDSNLKASDIVNAKSEDDGKDKKKQPTKLEKDGL